MLGIETAAALWRALACLPGVRESAPVAACQGSAKTRAVRYTWRGNSIPQQVRLVKIEGGGHAEPSMKKRHLGIFSRFPGRQNADLEIAEEAWAYFKEKQRIGMAAQI
jgi:polyhydroxybutyrate depolymerase